MNGLPLALGLGWTWHGLTNGQHRAARVRKNPINHTVASKILERRTLGGAQNDQSRMPLGGLDKNLDERVAMHHLRLDRRPAIRQKRGAPGGGARTLPDPSRAALRPDY